MPADEADRIEDALIAALDEDDAMTALQVLRELVVPASHYRGAVEALRHIAECADHPSLTVRSTSYLGQVARDALNTLGGQ